MNYDHETGLPRWDLPGGEYVLADAAIDGGGVRVMSPDGRIARHVGGREVASYIGASHPAIEASREETRMVRVEQAREASVLRQILRDGVRS
jgi:hypothetical protein